MDPLWDDIRAGIDESGVLHGNRGRRGRSKGERVVTAMSM